MIRIVVAEDSAVTRELLVELLGGEPGLDVVGVACNGEEAVQLVERLEPDVVVMDVHMPLLDGLGATRLVMERAPTRVLLVSASSSQLENERGFEALRAGAVMLMRKPSGPDHPDFEAAARELVATIRLVADVKVIRRWPRREARAPHAHPALRRGPIRLVAVGASTGGPPAIAEILSLLPGDLPCPVLVVQHIAPEFAEGFTKWLGKQTALHVKPAVAGERVQPGTVYVAADPYQLGLDTGEVIRLAREPSENGFAPSVSYLFRSVAEVYGSAAIGVLLTGMGRDGADGLHRLREAGGVTIAQDEESSVVFGMPGEAIRLGAAEHVLPPERIAALVRELAPARVRR